MNRSNVKMIELYLPQARAKAILGSGASVCNADTALGEPPTTSCNRTLHCNAHVEILSNRKNKSWLIMLYSAHSRAGRGNLVLRHSVPYFSTNSGGIAYWVAELNAACLEIEEKNGNKYLICSSGDWTHYQSYLQLHFVPLHHKWPKKITCYLCTVRLYYSLCC